MSDPNTPIPSVEMDEISDFDLGPSFLSQRNNMNRDSYFSNVAGNAYGRSLTSQQINPFHEQIRPRLHPWGNMESTVNLIRRDFLVGSCITSIVARLELSNKIYKEMEAYELVAVEIRNAGPNFIKAHNNKDTNVDHWKKSCLELHDILISASMRLQELEVNIFEGLPETALTLTTETL